MNSTLGIDLDELLVQVLAPPAAAVGDGAFQDLQQGLAARPPRRHLE
jgi:hypothetical protein